MSRNFGRLFGQVFLCIAIFGLTLAPANSAVGGKLKVLNECLDNKDMDCIESITMYFEDGSKSQYSQRSRVTWQSTDDSGNIIEDNQHTWSEKAGSKKFESIGITANLTDEKFYQKGNQHIHSELWVGVDQPAVNDIPPSARLKFVIRTTWLKPLNVAMYGQNPLFQHQKLTNGNRFTFVLSKFKAPELRFDPVTNQVDSEVSAKENWVMYFLIDHASDKPDVSVYSTECSDFGYTMESSNAVQAGQPYMSSVDSLNFAIGAPHKLSDGTQNVGYFYAQIQKSYLDCKWPNNKITSATGASISVIDQSGQVEAATTSAQYMNGTYYLSASGFHYSNPKIKLEASSSNKITEFVIPDILKISEKEEQKVVSSPSPFPSVSSSPKTNAPSKVRSITCVKNKTQITIKGPRPECPKGFKLK